MVVCAGGELLTGSPSYQPPISLLPAYAMSSTETTSMSGTDVAHATTTSLDHHPIGLRRCYAMSGTHIAYAATRNAAFMTAALVHPAICLRACYAMPDTA
eukprot:1837092-Rhodomonas_salina.1